MSRTVRERRSNADGALALVVFAQTGSRLSHLAREVKAVRRLLKRAGYQVVLERTPTWAGFRRTLEADNIRGRVAVLHFAGHAEGKGLLVRQTGAGGDQDLVSFRSLEPFLRDQGLAFAFLNACTTRAMQREFEQWGTSTALVVTWDDIPDEAATDLAIALYSRLLRGAPPGALRQQACGRPEERTAFGVPLGLRTAFDRSLEDVKASHPKVFAAANAGEVPDRSLLPWRLFAPLDSARLDDLVTLSARPPHNPEVGRNEARLSPVLLTLALIGVVSLLFAYVWATSPAFQGVFGYALPHGAVPSLTTLQWPYLGLVMELIRQALLLAFLGVALRTSGVSPLWKIRRADWLAGWPNMVTAIFIILALIGVPVYHLWFAPIKLEQNSNWQAILADPALISKVWQSAWRSPPPAPEQTLDRWHDLYLLPYATYMPYSAINFAFVAVSLFHVFLTTRLRRFRTARVWDCRRICAAVRTLTDAATVARYVTGARRQCVDHVKNGVVLTAFLLAIACFEAFWGYRSLSIPGQIVTLFALAIIIASHFATLALVVEYSRSISQARSIANDDARPHSEAVREALAASGGLSLLRDGTTAVALLAVGATGIAIGLWFYRLWQLLS
jgi:hypothetical protein